MSSNLFAESKIPPTIADPAFDSTVVEPAFATGTGPVVLFDASHNNFHTIDGRYKPVADVLRSDGYQVRSGSDGLHAKQLQAADLLVIASAVGDLNPNIPAKWRLPVPSALSEPEMEAIEQWVSNGGALLLIVDYMPLAAASAALAKRFDVQIGAGYAYDAAAENKLVFSRSDGTLADHPITRGGHERERIKSVHTFAGTALRGPAHAESLMQFESGAYLVQPRTLLPPDTPPPNDAPRIDVAEWSQGLVLKHGAGRIAIFGEAAMFSAQRYPNGAVMGMNHPQAADNKQFLINVVRWLSPAKTMREKERMAQQPRMVEMERKLLVGMSQNMSRMQDRTGQLWGSFMPKRAAIKNKSADGYLSMQVYPQGPAQISNPEAEFTKWAVVEVDALTDVPEGMYPYTLEAGLYAVFDHHGPATDLSTVLYIFQEWLPASEYRLSNREHFELLPEGYNAMDPNAHEEFWIPVEPK